MSNRDRAREEARGRIEEYLRGRGLPLTKPFRCLNPAHTDAHASMSYDRSRQRVKCFACGAAYDLFDLVGLDYGLTDFPAKLEKACSLYGIPLDDQQPAGGQKRPETKPAQKKPQEEKPEEDCTDYLRACFERAGETDYLQRRGISKEIAASFCAGYDPAYYFSGYGESPAVILMSSIGSYVARNIAKDAPEGARYRKKGKALLFPGDGASLNFAKRPIFITEGEIDAMSIAETGGEAVALGSTANKARLIAAVEAKKPVQPLIIALDNDDPGRKAAAELETELNRLQIPFYPAADLYGQHKDANEALCAEREAFTARVRAAEEEAARIGEAAAAAEEEREEQRKIREQQEREAAKAEYLKNSVAAHIAEFEDGIAASADTPAIKTGFYSLDELLDGGLYEGLYIIGAMSSLGKTTFALQLMDNIAEAGQDCLIFSLEMARSELMAKSISRHTYLLAADKKNAKTARGILTGARYAGYSTTEKQLIRDATAAYKKYAQHLFISEGVGDIGVEQIKETVQEHINATGRKPVVLIDYLQILAPADPRASDKQNTDKAVLELKRLSRDFKIPVIGISSFNRDSYKEGSTGRVSLTDFKESGAIEYGADILIGLEFAAARDKKDYSERDEKGKDPRQIRLVILKNRNGQAWVEAEFEYKPLFNYFTDGADKNGFKTVKNEADLPFKWDNAKTI